MAAKDDSVALWLHNKLGSTTHLWSFSSTVVSQYTLEKLHSIKDCFCTLDSLVKLKFFLSLFHIPKRCLEEFKPIVEVIIDNTLQTCLDQWVLSVAMFVKTFWLSQSLDTQYDYDLESFNEALTDLKQILKESIDTESGCESSRFLLPTEFDYLNREARFNVLPNTSAFTNEFLFSLTAEDNSFFTKHFTLSKPSKTTCKLSDLKNKAIHYSKSKTTKSIIHTGLNSYAEYNDGLSSSSYSSNRLGSATTMSNPDPYSSRIFSNSSNNLNSFNNKSQGSSSFFKRSMLTNMGSTTITGKSSTPKRNVGIKLLDAQEQSITPKEAKRKRKEHEKEVLKKQKQEQTKMDDTEQSMKQENLKSNETGLSLPKTMYTDDSSYFPQHNQMESQAKITESYKSNELQQAHSESTAENNSMNYFNNQTNQASNQLALQNQAVASISEILYSSNNQKQHQSKLNSHMLASNLQGFQDNFQSNAYKNNNNGNEIPNFINNQQLNEQLNDMKKIQQQVSFNNTEQVNSLPKLEAFTTQASTGSSILPPIFSKSSTLSFMNTRNDGGSDDQNESQQQDNRQQQIQQSLSLTREQMLQAQEMFSKSNQLSRPDKAQILGFIAGSRENPRPDQGSLVAIKLNESEETILAANGQEQKVMAELFFEMNYETGEYKKMKRLKNSLN